MPYLYDDYTHEQCPICYDERAVKEFTKCEHKICCSCLYKLVAAITTSGIACPLCRQGHLKQESVVKDILNRLARTASDHKTLGTPVPISIL